MDEEISNVLGGGETKFREAAARKSAAATAASGSAKRKHSVVISQHIHGLKYCLDLHTPSSEELTVDETVAVMVMRLGSSCKQIKFNIINRHWSTPNMAALRWSKNHKNTFSRTGVEGSEEESLTTITSSAATEKWNVKSLKNKKENQQKIFNRMCNAFKPFTFGWWWVVTCNFKGIRWSALDLLSWSHDDTEKRWLTVLKDERHKNMFKIDTKSKIDLCLMTNVQ